MKPDDLKKLLRSDFTLHSFGSLAIVLDEHGKLACVAVCVPNDGRRGGQDSMLARFSGLLYGMDVKRVRRSSEAVKAYKQG